MKRKIKIFLKKTFKKNPKQCKHGFEMLEVANLKIDPKCFWCDKKLSECVDEK